AEALAQVEAWYAERSLPPWFTLPLPASRRLDATLAEYGWRPPTTGDAGTPRRLDDVLVQTAPLTSVRAALPDRADLPPVRITDRPDADWLAMAEARKGEISDAAIDVLTGPPLVGFASVYDSGTLVATGRGTVQDGWLGLSL